MATAYRIANYFTIENLISTALLFSGGVLLAKLLVAPRFGIALIFSALLLTIPVALVMITKPRFGIFLLFLVSMIIISIKRISWQTEVGLLIEALEGMLAIGLVSSMILRRDVHKLASPLTLPVVFYILYNIILALHPRLPSIVNTLYSLREPVTFAVPFFAALYLVRDRQQLSNFLNMWLFFAVLIALYGLKQYYLGLNIWENAWLAISPTHVIYDRVRIFSTLGSADALGMHMAVSITLALGFAMYAKRRLIKSLAFATVPLFFIVDLFSLTRGSYLGAAVGVITICIITRSRVLILGLLLSAMVLIGWYQFNQGSVLASRLITMFTPQADESFAIRQSYINEYLPTILDHPFGLGPSTTGRQGGVLLDWAGIDPALIDSLAGVPTDNYYFRVALETGWVGLLLFLVILISIFILGLRIYFQSNDPQIKWFAVSLLSAYIAMAVGSYSNNYFSHVQLKLFFCFSMGVLANLPIIERESRLRDLTQDGCINPIATLGER